MYNKEKTLDYKIHFMKVVYESICDKFGRISRKAAEVIGFPEIRIRRQAIGTALLKTVGSKVFEAGVKELLAKKGTSSSDPPLGFMGNLQSWLYGTLGKGGHCHSNNGSSSLFSSPSSLGQYLEPFL